MITYTLDQVKKAFWAEFHLGGERWFNYLGGEFENQVSTEFAWEDFYKELKKTSNQATQQADNNEIQETKRS